MSDLKDSDAGLGSDPLGDPTQPWRFSAEAATRKAHAIGMQLNLTVISMLDPPHDFLPAEERAAMLFESEEAAKRLVGMIAQAARQFREAHDAQGPRPGDYAGLAEDGTVRGPRGRSALTRRGRPFQCERCGSWIFGPGLIETHNDEVDPRTWHEECLARELITDVHRKEDGNYAYSLPIHLPEALMAVRFTGVRLGGSS